MPYRFGEVAVVILFAGFVTEKWALHRSSHAVVIYRIYIQSVALQVDHSLTFIMVVDLT